MRRSQYHVWCQGMEQVYSKEHNLSCLAEVPGALDACLIHPKAFAIHMWVVAKIMVPFWIPIRKRHLILRVPNKGPQF